MHYNAAMSATPLILLHGWGMSPGVFDPLCDHLPSARYCLRPSLPGYAGSEWPAELAFERQLECMRDTLPGGSLLGWSLGGLYAIELAARYPAQFSDLTLIACNPCFVRRPGWDCALESAVFDGFYADLVQDRERTLRRFLALQMQGEAAARELTRSLLRHIATSDLADIDALRFGLDLLKNHDARTALQGLQQPVRVILGERDLLVPIELGRQIRELDVEIQVESLAGAAHVPFVSHPAEVAALIEARA